MRLRRAVAAAASWPGLFVGCLLLGSVAAKKEGGQLQMHMTIFEHAPVNLQYFDDSDVIMFQDWQTDSTWRSTDAGASWDTVDGPLADIAWQLTMHPFDSKRAYVLTEGSTHWMTSNRGETWEDFFTDSPPSSFRPPLNFHAGDPDRIIFNGVDCTGLFCVEQTMYTTSGFRDDTKFLRSETDGCYWAKSTDLFTTGQEDLDMNRILCISRGKYSLSAKDYRLVISDNYFTSNGDDIQEFEPELQNGRAVAGISDMAIVKKYLVAAARAEGTDEMALYVSDDTIKWHRAEFPHDHRLDEHAYTLLESTNYSIQIDVMYTRQINPMGVLFSSNSNGTYFTRLEEHTNREVNGLVDFEKMSGIQGIIMVNVVDNWEDVEKAIWTSKQLKSQISFDDGRTWQSLKIKGSEEALNLHSVTNIQNLGKVFSSPAPGLVMGVGNTGSYLGEYEDGDTYVSDDAGMTWIKALEGPHKYEFGDQGSILVAIPEAFGDVVKYSLNHGKDWEEAKLPEEMYAIFLTTTRDSTSLKFIIVGTDTDDARTDFRVVSLDFDGIQERQCKKGDLEKWYARVDDKGKPTCIMGHKQYYMRREADADCFMKEEFKDPEAKFEPCECVNADFECDFNFVRNPDRTECVSAGPLIIPEGECQAFDADTTFAASSGWRLIPGNDCERTDGPQKDDPVPRKCVDAAAPPASGSADGTLTQFEANEFLQKIYLERTETSTGDDETIVMSTDRNKIFLSRDSGKNWDEILKDKHIDSIIAHPFFNDVVYFVEDTGVVHYSVDRGENIRQFGAKPPSLPDPEYFPMSFHPKHKDWIIWTGVKDCDGGRASSGDCHAVASVTLDRGDNWQTLRRYVKKCEFIKDEPPQRRDDQLIYCNARKRESSHEEDNPWQLISSTDFFKSEPELHFEDIVDFATMSEFIVVAAENEDSDLKVDASVDGSTFAEALFPPNLKVPHQTGYTVMDSSTHSIFLHVTVDRTEGYEYGTIIKSNSNGTSYALSLSGVNRDREGYVDFEKMYVLEGVAVANIVSNYETAAVDGAKKLKTVMTHNDGAEWAYLPPPPEDYERKPFSCSGSLDKCSLHVQGYTQRFDKTHTYSSPSAVGLMMAVGNVGEFLGPYAEADTFMTTDAGITWKAVKKGSYLWEYGDQGSLIVIASDRVTTNVVYFSRNEGDTWEEFKFAEEAVDIKDITTVPSDNSRNFVLWVESPDGAAAVNLDFSGFTDRQCDLDEDTGDNDDYYLWTPKHPLQDDDCLFGHVSQYHRKRPSADCYNGREIQHLHNIANNCSCTRRDFECDYNFELLGDGSCGLVRNHVPSDHASVCAANPDMVMYWEPTGYRRIPLTTCDGGKDMEYLGQPKPCPGKEDEFERQRGLSSVSLFFAIVVPIAAAAGVGWWVWKNWAGRGFGQIRLGEQATFDDQAPYIKYPVMVVSAVVAVGIALPSLAGSLWNGTIKLFRRGRPARFTTRSSFTRDASYTAVDEDEGELLGEESDEEV
ncbi:MAG: vacuolar protein sorting/targeting protein PEP1 [Claussenomyces sp. TS43310]|nr:MAG: vacuolar protein sorting/targeting protein PEP1 [Claussenomyces sp. TS43310]